MKYIVIGSDHRGYHLKEFLTSLSQIGDETVSWVDIGTDNEERTDYPIYAEKAVEAIFAGDADCGILLCGSGVGMTIAANRFKGIYAVLAWDAEIAQRAKEEDKANVLVLPADYLEQDQAISIVQSWLEAQFLGGTYQNRVAQIDSLP